MKIQEFAFDDKKLLDSCMKRFCYYHENGIVGNKIYEGYNFPVNVIHNFTEKLTKDELWLKQNIKREVVYIVGYMKGNKEVRIHELRHADFYTNVKIQHDIKHVWKSLPKNIRTDIESQFASLGYNRNVWIDELYAYLNDRTFWSKKVYKMLSETYDFHTNKNEFKTKNSLYYRK